MHIRRLPGTATGRSQAVTFNGLVWAVGSARNTRLFVGSFVFRTQLVYSLFSRPFGKYDILVWGAIFFPLLLLRPVMPPGLGLADSGSLEPNASQNQIVEPLREYLLQI